MKRKILRCCIAAALCCCAIIGSAAAECSGAALTTTDVNLRSGAGTDNAILCTAAGGSAVILASAPEDGWARVYYNGQWGYMSADYLSLSPAADVSASGYVNGTGVRMRSAASTESAILRVTSYGESVEVTGVDGEWYRVNAGGLSGYIRGDYVELGVRESAPAPAQGSGSGSAIVAFAEQYLGVPYVWAGASPSGFDCSGFVGYVYKNFGYSTHRTAADMYSDGVSVSYSELQPGDAVFFASYSETIGHVGIYIGGGQFIHASSGKGCVVISSLSESYYSSMYVGARRIAI